MSLRITVVQGSILDANAEVIVNAANSHGIMGGGVAGVIRRATGSDVEQEARKQAPIPVGQAAFTSGGKTLFKGIIHAPTMPEPGCASQPRTSLRRQERLSPWRMRRGSSRLLFQAWVQAWEGSNRTRRPGT